MIVLKSHIVVMRSFHDERHIVRVVLTGSDFL